MKLAPVIPVNVNQSCETFMYFTIFHQFTMQIWTFSKNTSESKLKITKFSFWWVNFHQNWTKLTRVMLVNIIQSCETFWYVIVFHQLTMQLRTFSKHSSESKLKITKFSFWWVYIRENWMKLTRVVPVNLILWLSCVSSIYHAIIHFFEKYASIKIENHKIFTLMNKLSPKLDEVNGSYLCKYSTVLWDFDISSYFIHSSCNYSPFGKIHQNQSWRS